MGERDRSGRGMLLGSVCAGVTVALLVASRSGASSVSHAIPAPGDVTRPLYYPGDLQDVERATADDRSAEHLLSRFIDLHSALRYDEALVAARDLVARAPDRPIALYNLACVQARRRDGGAALDALERAVSCGWRHVVHTRHDPDLAALRSDPALAPRFEMLTERMIVRREAERIRARGMRTEPWTAIRDELDAAVPALLHRYHVPGVAVGLVRDGAIVWSGGYGLESNGSDRAMSVDTPVRLDAPGHLVSLIAAAQLESVERLDLGALLVQGEELAVPPPPIRRVGVRGVGFQRRVHQVRGGAPPGGDARLSFTDWPMRGRHADTDALLRMSVELETRRAFAVYCRDRIFAPLGLAGTAFADGPGPAADLCPGHTALGTPLEPTLVRHGDDAWIDTSCGDLLRLMHACLVPGPAVPSESPGLGPAVVHRLEGVTSFELGRLGLGVHRTDTRYGPRLQVADVVMGRGCLMRWYPEQACGLVVVFNAETGPDVALRIAAIALGGEE